MHNLIHELAVYVMAEFSFMLEPKISPGIWGTFRHLPFKEIQCEMAEKIGSDDHGARLRTFLPL